MRCVLGKVSYIMGTTRRPCLTPWASYSPSNKSYHMHKATPLQTVSCVTGPDYVGGKLAHSCFLLAHSLVLRERDNFF